jgi:hypothetical protein
MPQEEQVFAPRIFPLGDDMSSYIAVLAQRASGTISFRTGAGRIFRDLLVHWPTLHDWESEAQELCQRIADAVFPLVGALYAQAVELTATISWTPIEPPQRVDALSTYIVFDAKKTIERQCYLSPQHALPEAEMLAADRGVVVLCRPLHYRYHTIKDDRRRIGHPRAGLFEISQRLINEMLAQPDFVPRETRILSQVKTQVRALPKAIERAEGPRNITVAAQPVRQQPHAASTITTTTSLSALPLPVRALEHRLISYITDKSLSPELRVGLREVAQKLRAMYPQAVLEEAARHETVAPASRPLVRPSANAAPLAQTAHRVRPVASPRITPAAAVSGAQAAPLVTSPRVAAPMVRPAPGSEAHRPTHTPVRTVAAPFAAPPVVVGHPHVPQVHPGAPQPVTHPSGQPAAPQQRNSERRAELSRQPQRSPEPPREEWQESRTPQVQPESTPAKRLETSRTVESKPDARPEMPHFAQPSVTASATRQPVSAQQTIAPRVERQMPRPIPVAAKGDVRPLGLYDRLRTPIPQAFSKADQTAGVGQLSKTITNSLNKTKTIPRARIQKPRFWAAISAPSPVPTPVLVITKIK